MVHSSFQLSAAICMALAISAAPAAAQTAGGTANLSGGKVKIGVLTDIAGPTAMANGKGSVIAAEMAAEDFGAGLNVEVISADHGGKPDVGSQIAARWFDVEGVDAIADMQGSPIGFAVQNLAVQKSKIMLLSGSTSSDFNGKACSPLTVQWTVDTYNLAKGAAKAIIEAGGTKWYFLTVDQAYGHALSKDTSEQVKLNGGQVAGNSVFPPNTSDFASFLLTAHGPVDGRHLQSGEGCGEGHNRGWRHQVVLSDGRPSLWSCPVEGHVGAGEAQRRAGGG